MVMEPKSEFARYAYGYSNKKPSYWWWWLAILGLAIVLVLVGCSASPRDSYLASHMPPADWFPPTEFDHQYPGLRIIFAVPQSAIMDMCQIDRPEAMGCSWVEPEGDFGPTCMIVTIDSKVGDITPQAVIRHEEGHCNGWKHN